MAAFCCSHLHDFSLLMSRVWHWSRQSTHSFSSWKRFCKHQQSKHTNNTNRHHVSYHIQHTGPLNVSHDSFLQCQRRFNVAWTLEEWKIFCWEWDSILFRQKVEWEGPLRVFYICNKPQFDGFDKLITCFSLFFLAGLMKIPAEKIPCKKELLGNREPSRHSSETECWNPHGNVLSNSP